MTRPSGEPRPPAQSLRDGVITLSPGAVTLAGAALVAILVAIFYFFIQANVRHAIASPADWGHILLIPAISGYFVWLNRQALLATPFKPAWSGLVLLIAGMAIYFVAYLGPKSFIIHHNARGFGWGVTLFGLVLLLFGWRAMRYLWFPLAFFVIFGQTISDSVLQPLTERLQDISARGAWILLNIVGVDAERDGNVLTVWSNGVAKPLNVAEACSGMRMLFAFLALGVAIAYTGLPRVWQRTLLVLLGVPVAVGVNVLRVFTLGVLSLWDVNFAAGEFHHFVGLVWLVPAFLLYLGILWILRNVVTETPDPARAAPQPKKEPGTDPDRAAPSARSAQAGGTRAV